MTQCSIMRVYVLLFSQCHQLLTLSDTLQSPTKRDETKYTIPQPQKTAAHTHIYKQIIHWQKQNIFKRPASFNVPLPLNKPSGKKVLVSPAS